MIGQTASRLLAPAARQVAQSRGVSVIAGPPQVRVSTGETIVLGGAMICSFLAIPAWVLSNMKHYRAPK